MQNLEKSPSPRESGDETGARDPKDDSKFPMSPTISDETPSLLDDQDDSTLQLIKRAANEAAGEVRRRSVAIGRTKELGLSANGDIPSLDGEGQDSSGNEIHAAATSESEQQKTNDDPLPSQPIVPVLIFDDNNEVPQALQRMVSAHGLRSPTAADGHEQIDDTENQVAADIESPHEDSASEDNLSEVNQSDIVVQEDLEEDQEQSLVSIIHSPSPSPAPAQNQQTDESSSAVPVSIASPQSSQHSPQLSGSEHTTSPITNHPKLTILSPRAGGEVVHSSFLVPDDAETNQTHHQSEAGTSLYTEDVVVGPDGSAQDLDSGPAAWMLWSDPAGTSTQFNGFVDGSKMLGGSNQDGLSALGLVARRQSTDAGRSSLVFEEEEGALSDESDDFVDGELEAPEGYTNMMMKGRNALETGDFVSAEECFSNASDVAKDELGNFNRLRAAAVLEQANACKQLGKLKGASLLLRRAALLFLRVYGTHSIELVPVLNALAGLHFSQGRYRLASQEYKRALKLIRAGGDEFTFAAATTLHNMAQLYLAQDKTTQASKCIEHVLDISESLGPNHTEGQSIAVHALCCQATCFRQQGRLDEARKQSEMALTIAQRIYGAGSPRLLPVLMLLARLHELGGDLVSARGILSRGSGIAENAEKGSICSAMANMMQAHVRMHMARVAMSCKNWDLAISSLNSALNNVSQSQEGYEMHADRGSVLLMLGQAQRKAGSVPESCDTLTCAVEELTNAQGAGSTEVLGARQALAAALSESGQHEQALSLYEELIKLQTLSSGTDSTPVALTNNNNGVAFRRARRYFEAQQSFEHAAAAFENTLGTDSRLFQAAMHNLSELWISRLGRGVLTAYIKDGQNIPCAVLPVRVEVKFAEQRATTSWFGGLRNTESARKPVWNENFTFNRRHTDLDVIKVSVRKESMIRGGGWDYVGEVRLSIRQVLTSEAVSSNGQWFLLQPVPTKAKRVKQILKRAKSSLFPTAPDPPVKEQPGGPAFNPVKRPTLLNRLGLKEFKAGQPYWPQQSETQQRTSSKPLATDSHEFANTPDGVVSDGDQETARPLNSDALPGVRNAAAFSDTEAHEQETQNRADLLSGSHVHGANNASKSANLRAWLQRLRQRRYTARSIRPPNMQRSQGLSGVELAVRPPDEHEQLPPDIRAPVGSKMESELARMSKGARENEQNTWSNRSRVPAQRPSNSLIPRGRRGANNPFPTVQGPSKIRLRFHYSLRS